MLFLPLLFSGVVSLASFFIRRLWQNYIPFGRLFSCKKAHLLNLKNFKETKKATSKKALISECYLAGGLSCLHKASLA